MANREDKPNPTGFEAFKAAVEGREARLTAARAIWQHRVRDCLLRLFADLGQLQHGPSHDELTGCVLEVMAEQSSDPDFLALVAPFARGLPAAYRKRVEDRRSVEAFDERQETIRAGKPPPLEPLPLASEPVAGEKTSMTDRADKSNDDAQPEKPDPLVRHRALIEAFAKNKAIWQADLRLRFNDFMLDYGDRNHPPQTVEIAQFMLGLVAERCSDHDLKALILPFAERLPHELEKRRENGGIATEFLRVGHERRRHGPNGRPKKDQS